MSSDLTGTALNFEINMNMDTDDYISSIKVPSLVDHMIDSKENHCNNSKKNPDQGNPHSSDTLIVPKTPPKSNSSGINDNKNHDQLSSYFSTPKTPKTPKTPSTKEGSSGYFRGRWCENTNSKKPNDSVDDDLLVSKVSTTPKTPPTSGSSGIDDIKNHDPVNSLFSGNFSTPKTPSTDEGSSGYFRGKWHDVGSSGAKKRPSRTPTRTSRATSPLTDPSRKKQLDRFFKDQIVDPNSTNSSQSFSGNFSGLGTYESKVSVRTESSLSLFPVSETSANNFLQPSTPDITRRIPINPEIVPKDDCFPHLNGTEGDGNIPLCIFEMDDL